MSNETGPDMPLRLPLNGWLLDQLRDDAHNDRFAHWGRSTVIDEHVGGPVLNPETVRELADASGTPASYPEGNAGLLHVYGYLFSTVATPFGHKCDRWLDGALAMALGCDAPEFRPRGGPGTMLQRVTDAALPLFDEGRALPLRTEIVARRQEAIKPGLVAHLVLARAPGAAATALAYALESTRGLSLITLFPIAADPAAFLAEFDAEPPRLHYNAVEA